MTEKLDQLKQILAEVDDLGRASSVLGWDAQAYMPKGSAEARGQITGTLNRLSHARFTAPETAKLIEELQKWAENEDPESDDARLIKVTARQYEQQAKVPPEMVTERAEISAAAQQSWQQARTDSDYSLFQPDLAKQLDWVRRYSELFAPYDHIYDPLLDIYEPGMKTSDVQAIFGEIRPKQVELIQAISEADELNDDLLHQDYDGQKQMDFGVEVLTDFGYDWERGRQDKVTHPFMTNLGYGDQRITVRVYPDYFNAYLFGAMHEAGHAVYEQGIPKKFARSPLYGGASLGVHESQSRLWENLVGRSRPFWQHYFPKLQKVFPDQLGKASWEDFYKAINRVAPSFIRVEADEATYNLHIMLRLELEIGMLDGSISLDDLPDVWNDRFQSYLGITPPDDAQGVLQDVHWSFGGLGYFSTYALGNLISAQIWEVVNDALPNLEEQVGKGEFGELLDWLQKNIYIHGAKYEPQEIVEMVTGSKINGEAYLRYLNAKFGELYDL